MTWTKHFWKIHGERIVFMSAALVLAVLSLSVGVWFILHFVKNEAIRGLGMALTSLGTTVITGVVMLCYNKARGNGKEPDAVKPIPPEEQIKE